MNGNFARVGLCSLTRSVDLGSNSSIEMDGTAAVTHDAAIRGRTTARILRMISGLIGTAATGLFSVESAVKPQTTRRAQRENSVRGSSTFVFFTFLAVNRDSRESFAHRRLKT